MFVADSVVLEATLPGFRVDALRESGDERLLVEVRNSNPVSDEKRQKIVAAGLPCVEVDVSQLPEDIEVDELADRVTGFGDNGCPMKWIFHPEGESLAVMQHQEMQAEFDRRFAAAKEDLLKDLRRKMDTAQRKLVYHSGVEGCPLHVYRGMHSVSFLPDCVYCEYNLAWFGEGDEELLVELTGSRESHVYCGCSDEAAREYRAEHMKDMEILYPEDAIRIAWERDGEIALPPELFNDMEWCARFVDAHPQCRNCGKSHMRLRQNRTTGEVFWGCNRYPRCHEAFGYKAVTVLDEAMRFRGANRTPAWLARMAALDKAEAECRAMQAERKAEVVAREVREADKAVWRRLGLCS